MAKGRARKKGQGGAKRRSRTSDDRGGSRRVKKVGGRRLPARSSSARDAKKDQELVRLNKYLADHGVASRRGCDDLIAKGKVTIDGMPVSELGTKIDPTSQTVEVAGHILRPDTLERRYYLLNKPSGVVCTNEARETRPRAIDLITDPRKGRIYTVGRLDEESKGLILLTNDGEFAQRIAHPRYGVPKTYLVKVQGRISDAAVQKVREGVHLSDGKTSGARVLIRRRTPALSTLSVVLREGLNREVRRVFARVGCKVTSLTRTEIGPLDSRGLRVGRWRALSRFEVEALLDGSSIEAAKEPLTASRDPRKSVGRTSDRRGPAKDAPRRSRSGGKKRTGPTKKKGGR